MVFFLLFFFLGIGACGGREQSLKMIVWLLWLSLATHYMMAILGSNFSDAGTQGFRTERGFQSRELTVPILRVCGSRRVIREELGTASGKIPSGGALIACRWVFLMHG